jgi:hypothetical protein
MRMKREIRDKRYKLLMNSKNLRTAKFEPKIKNNDEVTKMMNEQDELYNKWSFYDNFIKANERISKNV